jgi:putative ABC transport system substrate-binding protein
MDRRTFIGSVAVGVLAAPLAVEAQQGQRVWRIGYLGDGFAASRTPINLDPFRDALSDLGYVEGRNLVIEARWSDGDNERLATLANDLVRRQVDVIVTHGLPASRAAKKATRSIPIVVAVISDIVDTGIVESLARPGGNVTGMTDQVVDLSGKEVELLKEMIPSLRRVGVIWNRSSENAATISRLSVTAARKSGLDVVSLDIQSIDDLGGAIEAAIKAQVGAVVVVHDPLTVGNRARIADALIGKRLPSVSGSLWLAEAGILMAYGPDQTGMFRHAAVYVDKILKGAKPSDLPVEQPTGFELVINSKTAKALGLAIPPSLLLRADEVIQ